MCTINVYVASPVDKSEIEIMTAILGAIEPLCAEKDSQDYFCIHSYGLPLVCMGGGPTDLAIGPPPHCRLASTIVVA